MMMRMMQLRRKRQAYHKCSKLYVLFDTPIREPMQLNSLEPSLTGDKILSSKSAIELKQFSNLENLWRHIEWCFPDLQSHTMQI